MRDSPTAKSAMSIISWTSPSASARVFPTSRLTTSARSRLCHRSTVPICRTMSPRFGAGTMRQARNAAAA